jgi:hypothetical protein
MKLAVCLLLLLPFIASVMWDNEDIEFGEWLQEHGITIT